MIDLILIISFIIVLLRIIVFTIGAIIERNKRIIDLSNDELPFVSVVIPARNEEKNIRNCLNSISQSDYPTDKYEIIAVNDRSTDNTKSVLEELSEKISNLRIVNITNETAIKNLKGKPGALQAGIESAKSDIIIMTDADCTVHKQWIRTMTSVFNDPNIGLVASYPGIRTNTVFDKIQAVEWTYLHTLASAGFGLNQPLSSYGNNISVRKKDFLDIGGYHAVGFSVTEDLALVLAMHNAGKGIRHLTIESGSIITLPCPTLRDYIKQHHRWVIGGKGLGWKAFVFVLTSLAMWVGLLLSLITLQPIWFLAFLLQRIIGDFILTAPTAIILNQKKIIKWIIPSVFFFIPMELLAPFFLLKKDVNWKGQIFKN
jgi:cellulose synthase/poly-beta-1,6-N-acetylglucosamine synthase-like glycosyltransferase